MEQLSIARLVAASVPLHCVGVVKKMSRNETYDCYALNGFLRIPAFWRPRIPRLPESPCRDRFVDSAVPANPLCNAGAGVQRGRRA